MILILLALFITPAFAQDTAKQRVVDFLRELSELEETLQAHPECAEFLDDAKPSCAKLSDTFCSTLWSDKNRGNMAVLDGELRTGKSSKSDMSITKLANLQALAESGPRLPADLAQRAEPVLKKMQAALAEESDNDAWYRRMSRLEGNFQGVLDEVADERAAARFPAAKAKRPDERSTEEKVRIKMIKAELRDQVLEAKYAQHPNWKRVEETFAGVKSAMLKMVEDLPFSPELRERLRTKLATVTLSLPYSNNATIGADESCGNTDVNAAYSSTRNIFYVCAGTFNSLLSPSALAFVIAHELGHSIDIDSQFREAIREKPVHQALQPLLFSKGKAISCEKWRSTLESIRNTKYSVKEPANRAHPLDHLVSCFVDRSDLQPFTLDAVAAAASRRTAKVFGGNADAHIFIGMAQPSFRKYGTVRANDKFMRPDIALADDNDAFEDGQGIGDPRAPELLGQALACQSQQADGKEVPYAAVTSETERATLFANALEEAKLAYSAELMETYLTCGETCPGLVDSGLSARAGENMADWYALRTITKLLDKQKGLAERRETALAASSFFCNEPAPETAAPAMALVEKGYSQEEHPDHRLRRLSLFTKENAELLGCTVEKENAGFSQCMP